MKFPNYAHSNLKKNMKIYFQLRIPKYLEATYAISKAHIIK